MTTAPGSIPDFTASMPMFLEDGHEGVARGLAPLAAHWPMDDHDPQSAIDRLREANAFQLLVPDALNVRSLCVAREIFGYVSPLADSIFAVQGLGSHPLVMTPSFPKRAELLHEVATGARIGAFGLTEPDAGSDVASMKTVARAEGDHWVLDGEKVFISNVGIAHHYIVFANADLSRGKKGISAFFVSRDAVTLEPIPMSLPHPLGRVVMKATRGALIGEVGQGMKLALGTLDVFRTSVGAAACGMARRALDEAIKRTRSRSQFGQRIADFQLTQAALAEMATELDAARLLVYRAAWLKDHGQRATVEVAMAKMYATEAAQRIIDRAVQLFGGSGVVTGSVVEQLYREIRPLRIYEGTTEIQKLIIGSALVGEK
jgi:acyl-CoA dehydrogenase